MDYRSLGSTGLKVSPVCLGTMNFGGPTDEAESARIMSRAIDGGLNFFDTANVYNAGESEAVIGRWLAARGRRDDLVLATKVYGVMGEDPNDRGVSYRHVIAACDESLRRLQTDYIDLYQLHRPDFDVPQDETLRAFDDLRRAGKIRYAGCSTHPAWLVMEALATSEKHNLIRYVSEQPPYNLLDRRIENELIPLCRRHGLGIIPWSPLAMGILAGRYNKPGEYPEGSRAARLGSHFQTRVTPRGVEVGRQVCEMAAERDMAPGQLALLWIKDQPGITAPIYGPRTLEQFEEALAVCDMTLAEEDRPRFDELVAPGNAVSDFHNTNNWMKARI